jgi:NAD(P)H-flavin reductase
VRGPFGTAWPTGTLAGKDVVFVTGGIGLAPLRPSIYQIAAHRDRYGSVSILYGARTPHDLLYTDELETWRAAAGIDVQVTVDSAETGWEGRVGLVTKLIPGARFDPANTVALICGPEVMMRFTILELKERGLGDEQIYVSLERNMKCGAGLCGHCQFGPYFICKNGAVFRYDNVSDLMKIREV